MRVSPSKSLSAVGGLLLAGVTTLGVVATTGPAQGTVPTAHASSASSASSHVVTGAPTAARATGVARFRTYGAPQSISGAHDAGEPSIGTSYKSGSTFYQAGLSTLEVRFRHGHARWSDVSAGAAKGCPQGSTVSLDPILWTDHSTGRTIESQLSGVDSLSCYTDDDGKTWSPSQGGGIPSGVDHQTVGGGAFAKGDPAAALAQFPKAVYYCSQDIVTAFCAESIDGGRTFADGVPTWTANDCDGLHGHVKVAPDGTAYLPNKSCGKNQAVAVTTTGSTVPGSWSIRSVPHTGTGDSDPSVGVARNGTVFFGYVENHKKTARHPRRSLPGVAVSNDRGQHWVRNHVVGKGAGVKNAVFPAVVAGSKGRAAIAYVGTTTPGNYQAKTFKGVWHLYVDVTYDGGRTWRTVDVTKRDPVQRGSICTGGTTCGNDRNLLDFIDVTTDKAGRIEVAYADGCTGACVTDPGKNNHDSYAVIARQSGGRTLVRR